MDQEELYAIALSLEGEELEGAEERVLDAQDIVVVLECLDEQGVDLSELVSGERVAQEESEEA